MVSLKDIWDAPVVPLSPQPIPTEKDGESPSKHPLFLVDSDEEQPSQPKPASDIDAMFAGMDDDDFCSDPLPAAPDLVTIRREAAARHTSALASLTPHEIMPSSSPARDLGGDGLVKESIKDGERKRERRKIPKLDEGRLLGVDGFLQLIKDTKHFKPKGKGHEASDLNSLMLIYGFWTHKLFPTTQFKDTVDRVEKICHSKRMQVALSVWRDEAKGIIHNNKPDIEGVLDLTSDTEPEDTQAQAYPPSSFPPSSASEPDNDFDIEEVIRLDDERRVIANAPDAATPTVERRTGCYTSREGGCGVDGISEDDATWDELTSAQDVDRVGPPLTQPPSEDDQDMWDVVDEIEMQIETEGGAAKPATPTDPGSRHDHQVYGNDWDEMYAS